MSIPIMIALGAIVVVVAALVSYVVARFYEARTDRTFMTHDDRGFKRALQGKGVLWNYEESVVRGSSAPKVEYVAMDPATGGRKLTSLMEPRTGAISLRPKFCAPLPFTAMTVDSHAMQIDARVQFSLNRDLLKYVYQLEDFALALENRIQSAFRAEIGRLKDEELRAQQQMVAERVIELLRRQEREGDEAGEAGMALGVNFHVASFSFAEPDYETGGAPGAVAGALAAGGATAGVAAARARAQGVLALRPQQLDQLADVFNGRDPAATRALLTLLELQTRQNIAEALASSGQLVVVTAQELGLMGIGAQREAVTRMGAHSEGATPPTMTNGGARSSVQAPSLNPRP